MVRRAISLRYLSFLFQTWLHVRNKVSPSRDVTLLARRVLPPGELCAYASVTDNDRRRQTPATVTSLAPTLCVGGPVINLFYAERITIPG